MFSLNVAGSLFNVVAFFIKLTASFFVLMWSLAGAQWPAVPLSLCVFSATWCLCLSGKVASSSGSPDLITSALVGSPA